MPKLFSKLDPGVSIAFAIGLLAVWPLFAYPSLPLNTDAEIHILRAAEVKESILSGVLYPRWANDFYYGNGYPIFSFYAPLTYHLAAYWSIITGTDVVAGSKAVLVASGLLGTLGMYLFVRNRCAPAEFATAPAARRAKPPAAAARPAGPDAAAAANAWPGSHAGPRVRYSDACGRCGAAGTSSAAAGASACPAGAGFFYSRSAGDYSHGQLAEKT